ncbi:MAG: TIGR02281 family clan AA aspartic protease [Alphaproteobacteria bacterium]|nr:TIGR02281 family clan AA aspartic protease [Alphaproteobacteria bacterium]
MAVVAIVALVGLLVWRFPDAVSADDWPRLVYLTLLLALVSSYLLVGRYVPLATTLKQALLWIAIAMVLVVGYSFRVEIGLVGDRVLGELLPHRGIAVGERAIALRAGRDGHFRLEALVNDRPVRFLVDTGATSVILSRDDAERLGYDLDRLRFTQRMETANGSVRGAPVRLDSVEIGALRLADLPAIVNEGEMRGSSLLGISFLKRLKSYEVRDGELVLRW